MIRFDDIKYDYDDLNEIVSKLKYDPNTDQINIDFFEAKSILDNYFSDDEVLWLVGQRFIEAPAAVKYHGNYKGGLFIHSLLVGLELENLTRKLDLKWANKKSPMRIGLLHDICKTDDYKFGFVNTYDNELDKSVKQFQISYNNNKKYEGHGDKSVIMLSGHININEQEKICIIYHMGAFTDKDKWSDYSRSCNKEPNVLYTHTADMIASQVRGV